MRFDVGCIHDDFCKARKTVVLVDESDKVLAMVGKISEQDANRVVWPAMGSISPDGSYLEIGQMRLDLDRSEIT